MSHAGTRAGQIHSTGSAVLDVHPDLFRRSRVFGELDADSLSRLAGVSELVVAAEGTTLCSQGEPAERLFILLEGQVTLYNTAPDGTTAVVEVIQPGGHFVLATLLARLPLLLSARTTGTARLVATDGEGLRSLIQEEPVIATAVMRAEALDFSALVRQVCDLKMRTTAQRLGCYLLELSDARAENTATLRLPFDKRLLAARLGCRQENLSRAFAALRSFGVETHGARIILHDIARLRAYAVPDELDGAAVA
jgi:CRP/FNR family transcriptional regulator, transcriptional activator FtrB